LKYLEALDYRALIDEHDDAERRFRAGLHGIELQQKDGRVHGMRRGAHERMKQRFRRG
jgi:hypothetical protein